MRRPEQRVSQASFAPGLAAALNQLLTVRVIVVRQFFTGLDVLRRPNPDGASDDLTVAVRLTGVIDEAGNVPVHVGVADPLSIDRETPDASLLEVASLALQALFVIDQLTGVVDDSGVFVDWLKGEDAPPVKFRATPHDFGKLPRMIHPATENNRA